MIIDTYTHYIYIQIHSVEIVEYNIKFTSEILSNYEDVLPSTVKLVLYS